MKVIESILEVPAILLKIHPAIREKKKGIYCLTMLRDENGKRSVFQESLGVRIFDIESAEPDVVVIDQMRTGWPMNERTEIQTRTKLFLTDLMSILIYDHMVQFFSRKSVDFAYLINDPKVDMIMLDEWLRSDHGIVRYRWSANDGFDEILDQNSLGRKMKVVKRCRSIDCIGEFE